MTDDVNPYDPPSGKSLSNNRHRWPAALLVIAAVGNVAAALNSLSFLRYPIGSYFAIAGENLYMVPIVLVSAISGIIVGIIAVLNRRHLFLTLFGIGLCFTPYLVFTCIKSVIFRLNDLSE